jgi:hypothetical protein
MRSALFLKIVSTEGLQFSVKVSATRTGLNPIKVFGELFVFATAFNWNDEFKFGLLALMHKAALSFSRKIDASTSYRNFAAEKQRACNLSETVIVKNAYHRSILKKGP